MTEPGLEPRRPGANPTDVRPDRIEIDGLLRAVGRGDDAAFARLYDLLAPRVFGLARRVLRDPAQAEEMAGLLAAGQDHATELIEGVRGSEAFAVSLEPAGGSRAPTTTPLVGIPLA
jgi:hypothetical protein